MNKIDKQDYERDIESLPSHIRELLSKKLSLDEIEILHTYTIQQKEEHINQTRLDLQKELDGLLERINDAGFSLENFSIQARSTASSSETDGQDDSPKSYAKPSDKRLENARLHPSNIFAVNWLANNHHKYQLGNRNTGRADYEKAVKSSSTAGVKEVSPANYRCMLAVLKHPQENIKALCQEYRAGSPAAIWAVPLILQSKP